MAPKKRAPRAKKGEPRRPAGPRPVNRVQASPLLTPRPPSPSARAAPASRRPPPEWWYPWWEDDPEWAQLTGHAARAAAARGAETAQMLPMLCLRAPEPAPLPLPLLSPVSTMAGERSSGSAAQRSASAVPADAPIAKRTRGAQAAAATAAASSVKPAAGEKPTLKTAVAARRGVKQRAAPAKK
jgi:hypothetical protein